jgi:hypothetical protein
MNTESPPPEPPIVPRPEVARFESLFVWGVWLLLTIMAVRYVWSYSVNLYLLDDWQYVPLISGERPFTVSWMWSPYNGHRMFFSRLFGVWLGRLFDGDPRPALYLNVLFLSSGAALLIGAARGARGRTSWTDSMIPLLLVQLGQWESLWYVSALGSTFSVVLLGAILWAACTLRDPLDWKRSLVVAVASALLPLTMAQGMIYGLALLPALAWLGFRDRRSRAGLLLLGGSLVLAVLAVLFLIGHHMPQSDPPRGTVVAGAKTSFQFIATSIGASGRRVVRILSPLLVLFSGGCIVFLLRAWRNQRPATLSMPLLCSMIAGILGIAAAVGYARSGFPQGTGFAPHYMAFSAMLPVFLFLSIQFLQSGRLKRVGEIALWGLAVFSLNLNTLEAVGSGEHYSKLLKAVIQDIDAGRPCEEIAENRFMGIYPSARTLGERLRMLERHHLGPFKSRPPSGEREPGSGIRALSAADNGFYVSYA